MSLLILHATELLVVGTGVCGPKWSLMKALMVCGQDDRERAAQQGNQTIPGRDDPLSFQLDTRPLQAQYRPYQ